MKPEAQIAMITEFVSRMSVLYHAVGFWLIEIDQRTGTRKKLLGLEPHQSVSARFLALGWKLERLTKMREVSVTHGKYTIMGMLSHPQHDCCESKRDCQHVYVNDRWVRGTGDDAVPIATLIDKVYRSILATNRTGGPTQKHHVLNGPQAIPHPCFVLQLLCPTSAYDVLSEPDKTKPVFRDPLAVRTCVKALLMHVFTTNDDASDDDTGYGAENRGKLSVASSLADLISNICYKGTGVSCGTQSSSSSSSSSSSAVGIGHNTRKGSPSSEKHHHNSMPMSTAQLPLQPPLSLSLEGHPSQPPPLYAIRRNDDDDEVHSMYAYIPQQLVRPSSDPRRHATFKSAFLETPPSSVADKPPNDIIGGAVAVAAAAAGGGNGPEKSPLAQSLVEEFGWGNRHDGPPAGCLSLDSNEDDEDDDDEEEEFDADGGGENVGGEYEGADQGGENGGGECEGTDQGAAVSRGVWVSRLPGLAEMMDAQLNHQSSSSSMCWDDADDADDDADNNNTARGRYDEHQRGQRSKQTDGGGGNVHQTLHGNENEGANEDEDADADADDDFGHRGDGGGDNNGDNSDAGVPWGLASPVSTVPSPPSCPRPMVHRRVEEEVSTIHSAKELTTNTASPSTVGSLMCLIV